MLISLIVIITLQCMHISKHPIVHFIYGFICQLYLKKARKQVLIKSKESIKEYAWKMGRLQVRELWNSLQISFVFM